MKVFIILKAELFRYPTKVVNGRAEFPKPLYLHINDLHALTMKMKNMK